MNVLKDVREKESSIEMEIAPIFDMYAMLDHYLPGVWWTRTRWTRKKRLRPSWHKLADLAEDVATSWARSRATTRRSWFWTCASSSRTVPISELI